MGMNNLQVMVRLLCLQFRMLARLAGLAATLAFSFRQVHLVLERLQGELERLQGEAWP